jgi:predicted short-subunit dehydrogenase-like oxidoreductase (DUF2520 family)
MTEQHPDKDRIAIIGLGKVGTAVGRLLKTAGYKIVAVFDPQPSAIEQHIPYTGGRRAQSAADAAGDADAVLITTGDDFIAPVCRTIAEEGGFSAGRKVVHMSGAGGLDLLTAAKERGCAVASIHPIQTFADVEGAVASIPGSTFGVTADDGIKDWAVAFVRDLNGTPVFIAEKDKPLYHAAACMASNYLTTLIHTVETIYGHFGLDRESSVRAIRPLLQGTLQNIETKGTVQALTGPIARGDVETVRTHIRTLRSELPDLLEAYCVLGELTVGIALEKKSLSAEGAAQILKLIRGR